MADHLEKLKDALTQHIMSRVPVQTLWATCKSTDLTHGVMVAEVDGVEYFDVLLGLGDDLREPVEGATVLLQLVQNNKSACMLLWAEEWKEIDINGSDNGGLVKSDAVATETNKAIDDLNTLKQKVASWVPVPNDGGAALKAALTDWAGQLIEQTEKANLENAVVKHGG